MKKRNLLYTLLAALLVVLLAVTPANTHAEEEDHSVSKDGMTVVKEVNVQEDGTYIVDLEAFATGQVEFSEKIVPVDLVLVLDVSGSMDWNINEYEYTARTSQGYSYREYGNNTYYYKHTDGNYYPVSRGSYYGYYFLYYTVGSETYFLSGTGITTTFPTNITNNNSTIWTGVLYTRRATSSQSKIAALRTAVNGFVDVVAQKNAETREKLGEATTDADLSRVALVKFAMNSRYRNSSYANYQSYIGNNYDDDDYNYTQVVKDMTVVNQADLNTARTGWHATVNGLTAAGATAADYGMGYAEAIYNTHHNDYEDRQTVVVMFTDGAPTYGSTFSGTVANNTVTYAKALKDAGVKVFTVAVLENANPAIDPPEGSNENNYLHAVSSNYPDATSYTNVGDRAMKEDGVTKENYYFSASSASELSNIFTAIAQSSASTTSQVGAQSVMKDIVSSSFTLPNGATEDNINVSVVPWDSTTHNWSETTSYTAEQWKTECRNYGAAQDAEEIIDVTISEDGKTIDVTGFAYSTHFLATNNSDEDHDGVNAQAAKLVISFEIDARPSAVTGGSVATNGEASGIYLTADSEEAIINFPVPQVVFTPVTYVVDYVNLPSNGDNKPSTITLDYSHVLKNVTMLDDPSDDVLKGKLLAATGDEAFDFTIFKGRYGTISFGDSAADVNNKMFVRYAPTTMNWDDYDRIFIKGESATESNLDVWAMLAVLPANSVYYEDTYVTKETNVTYNNHEVTIEYTGINYDSNWSSVGAEGANNTQHAEGLMGWIDVLADDPGYSNGEAHTADANTAKAKATFTFSGTGVDIYSRTNGSTGTITVNAKSTAENNESGKKVNKSKIIDTKAAAGDYYGIPVCTFTDLPYGKYDVTITVTAGAKKEGRTIFYLDGIRVYNPIKPHEGEELVQQMYGEQNLGAVFTEVRSLLGTGATATALFIDEHTTTETVTDLEAIEKAAQDLAKAQDELDAYVEDNVTPKQIVLNEAEAALAGAKEGDENYEALKAARDAAKVAVDTALAGKAPYEEAVAAARTAYDAANTGAEVTYTTTDVAEYKKEGPLGEVLLDAGESVTISVESGKTYYVGLKSLDGSSVTAEINGKAATFTHTADLYYDATPASGSQIVIRNGGQNILSVTKLRTTGKGNTTNGTSAASTEELLAYVRTLRTMPVTEYTGNVLTEDAADDTVVSAETTVEEETETVIEEDEITIENEDPVSEDTEATEEPAVSGWYRFLSSFFGFFRP